MSRRRRDDRLTSLWSFCARRAQCMSRDFTTATVAVGYTPHAINTKLLASQPHYKWDNVFSILRPCTAGINVSVMCNLSNEELQLDESFPDVISDSYTSNWQLNQQNCQSRNELPRWLKLKLENITKLPLKRVTIFSQEAGSLFMIAYGTKMTCMPLKTLYRKV